MKLTDHSIGITPILIRRAAYYLSLGLGTYFPDHPHYNKVTVELLYPIIQNAMIPSEWALGVVVSFYQDNHKVRWLDFSCRLTGAGGDPLMKELVSNE